LNATKDEPKSASGFIYDKGFDDLGARQEVMLARNYCWAGLEANSDPIRGNTMDEHRVAGAARNVGGRVEEGLGRVTGDAKSQVHGVLDQAQGTAENLYGQAKDAASSAAEGVRKTGVLI
jgi:uncharacterized protein YjbJ (UPF0337 family)